MPIITMLEIFRPSAGTMALAGVSRSGKSPSLSRAVSNCARISSAVRLRTSFCVPVWQNEQVSVQPTWLEMHSVPRPCSGMRFSFGSPITAADVVFSLERIHSDKKSAYPAPLGALDTISATDAKTVVVKLKSPFAPFLGNLEIWNMGIVSKADVDKRGEDAFVKAPLTSGPYAVKEWKPNEKLVLEPNAHYWREGYPKSDATVELMEIASPETRQAMLTSGEVDVMRAVPWAQIDALKKIDTIDMRLEPSTTIYMTLLSEKREPFSNMKARQAAAYAIDNKAMTKAITRGYAV